MLCTTTLFALACCVAPQNATQEGPVLPEKIDREMFGRAWTKLVKLDGVARPVEQQVAGLGAQAGIDIRIEDEAAARLRDIAFSLELSEWRWYGSHANLSYDYAWIAKHYKIGPGEEMKITYGATNRLGHLQWKSKPVPLGMVLQQLATHANLDIAYRKDHLLVARYATTRDDARMTRTFALTKAGRELHLEWNTNGVPAERRVPVADLAAFHLVRHHPFDALDPADKPLWDLARAGLESDSKGWPRGAAKAAAPVVQAEYDPVAKKLTVTADHRAIIQLEKHLKELDQPDPVLLAAEAVAFREAKLAALARAAEAVAGKELAALLDKLDSENVADRDAAEAALAKGGLAAAAGLLARRAESTDPEFRVRATRILARIHGLIEVEALKARAAEYLKAGMAGELEKIRAQFWSKKRGEDEAKGKIAFDEAKQAAKGDPAKWKQFLESQGLPPDTKEADADYDKMLKDGLAVLKPVIERLRFSGPAAEVWFSCELPAGHPMQDVRREIGATRLTSRMTLEWQDGAWVAGDEKPWSVDEGVTWTPKDGLGGRVLETKTKDAGRSKSGAAGWVTAYAIGFGY